MYEMSDVTQAKITELSPPLQQLILLILLGDEES